MGTQSQVPRNFPGRMRMRQDLLHRITLELTAACLVPISAYMPQSYRE
jgi:hypothetical protein